MAHSLQLFKMTGAIPVVLLHHIIMHEPAAYVVASDRNGTLYVGVTSDIGRRVYEHRKGVIPGFTKRYHYKVLVWFEFYESMIDAIAREKHIKGQSRKYKLRLIEDFNLEWNDLFKTIA